jgi:trk system potassium uptake protein TrkA
VRLMGLRQGHADVAKLTLPEGNPLVGQRVNQLDLPANTVLVTVVRGSSVLVPRPADVLQAGDELLFVADSAVASSIQAAVLGAAPDRDSG